MHKKAFTLLLLFSVVFSASSMHAFGVIPLLLSRVVRITINNKANAADAMPNGSDEREEVATRLTEEHITFEDVIGAHQAKEALNDIIIALKHPEIYNNIGAKIPRGVLLEGNPGNGKTLLAKALAHEASVDFIAISGADFSDRWCGEGVRKVKELFTQAREKAPCIIFIDEIDAIGMRGHEFGGGAQAESNRVIAELLTQLDGMKTNVSNPIIVVGATNDKNRLDPAILRSGRFDVAVRVDDPSYQERCDLLMFYSKKIKLSDSIDFGAIAARTQSFSGADCANLVNQAALCAVRKKAQFVEQSDFIQALETRNIQKR